METIYDMSVSFLFFAIYDKCLQLKWKQIDFILSFVIEIACT